MRHRPVVCASESLETKPGRGRRAQRLVSDVRGPRHPTAVSSVNGLQARARNMVPGVPQECRKASVGGHPR